MNSVIIFLLCIFFQSYGFTQTWSDVHSLIKEKENILFDQFHLTVSSNDATIFEEKNQKQEVYDIASLTKVMATTTAIMILVERGKLKLNDKVFNYLPEFSGKYKKIVTIEDLLRHESGLRSGLVPVSNEGLDNYLTRVAKLSLSYYPRTKVIYSDLGFILLSQIVEKVSKKSFDAFCEEEIFRPLKMKKTSFNPMKDSLSSCVPTLTTRSCIAHDPVAYEFYPRAMGHAGLFSSAQDIKNFVIMLLNQGIFEGRVIISASSINIMSKKSSNHQRGLGWDILSESSINSRGDYFPRGNSFGHTGYTGITLWIDQEKKQFYLFLSNRTYLGDELTRAPFVIFRKNLSNKIGGIIYGALEQK